MKIKRTLGIGIILVAMLTGLVVGIAQAGCSTSFTEFDDIAECSGTVAVIYLDGATGDGYGNDSIINNGTIGVIFGDSDIGNGYGNDRIVNNGTSSLILGDSNIGIGVGNDRIVNNGTSSLILGDSNIGDGVGGDTIINNGAVTIISGDTNVGDGYGRDVLVNNGTAVIIVGDTIVGAGYGDDLIINNGTVLLLAGDSLVGYGGGDDLIINYGTVGDIFGDSISGLSSGNDVIINAGTVTGTIQAGGGNDRVIIIGSVTGLIDGGAGYDILESVINGCVGMVDIERINEVMAFANQTPSGGTFTINGNSYTWTNFEELHGLILIYFCDGRNEIADFATPLVSYCNIYGGLDIYDVAPIGTDGRTKEGVLVIRADRSDLVDALAGAANSGQHQLIAEDAWGNQLWALASRELQIMGPEVDDSSKTYTFILDPALCNI